MAACGTLVFPRSGFLEPLVEREAGVDQPPPLATLGAFLVICRESGGGRCRDGAA
jgi:hypothetical protein